MFLNISQIPQENICVGVSPKKVFAAAKISTSVTNLRKGGNSWIVFIF